jgi:hypothetical protein
MISAASVWTAGSSGIGLAGFFFSCSDSAGSTWQMKPSSAQTSPGCALSKPTSSLVETCWLNRSVPPTWIIRNATVHFSGVTS